MNKVTIDAYVSDGEDILVTASYKHASLGSDITIKLPVDHAKQFYV